MHTLACGVITLQRLLPLLGGGGNPTFEDEPLSVSAFSFPLRRPVEIGDAVRDRLWVHIYNHDRSMAPAGKSSIIVILNSVNGYWEKLAEDRNAYMQKKEEIARTTVNLLEQRFPGLASQVEVTDVATPLTFKRYTGNWQGSFEGWLITPENSKVIMKPMSQQLPGLRNFYMCGQWVEPGGGLPAGVISARKLIKATCREERRKFRTTIG